MTAKEEILREMHETGVVAVIRAKDSTSVTEVAEALSAGGITFVEITMTVPGAIEVIRDASAKLKGRDIRIGVGTVLDVETAEAAIAAGASYVVSPVLVPEIIDLCKNRGVAVMPGVMTPTEAFNAWQMGADVVKIFPAGVGGPGFFKAMQGPLPQVRLMPTGGVNAETAPRFIKAGAFALGAGGSLVGAPLIESRDFDTITANARLFIEAVAEARRE